MRIIRKIDRCLHKGLILSLKSMCRQRSMHLTTLFVITMACGGIGGTTAFMPNIGRGAARASIQMKASRAQQDSRRSMINKTLRGALGSVALTVGSVSTAPLSAAAKGVKRLKNAPVVKLPSGVEYQDMSIGSGATPQLGDRVAVHYSLYYNGLEVESSRDSSGLAARPYGFNWGSGSGSGSICKGVQLGMEGMQIGGRRKITVPSELAFGKKGLPPFIPGDATVLFDVSIWSIKPAGVNPNLTLPGQQNYF